MNPRATAMLKDLRNDREPVRRLLDMTAAIVEFLDDLADDDAGDDDARFLHHLERAQVRADDLLRELQLMSRRSR